MKILKGINKAVTYASAVVMAGLLLFSGYALWSNNSVFRSAQDVFNDLLPLKPEVTGGDSPVSGEGFDELRQINPDIRAWLTVDNTGIDYPVVQGDDNLYYMSRDVFGESSLAGSIFLDSRNSPDLSDRYFIIYGHHMEKGLMFGDLDKFLDPAFFEETRRGYIISDNGRADYSVLAVIEAADSTEEIFDPTKWSGGLEGLYEFLAANANLSYAESMTELRDYPSESQVVALVTCTTGQTGERLVVFLYRRIPGEDTTVPEETTTEPEETTTVPDETTVPEETTTGPEGTTEPPDTPPTGDGYAPLFWLFAFIASGISLVCILKKICSDDPGGET